MVVFDELRITNDGETLIIKVRVRKEDYYKDVYIKSIHIDTEETFNEGTYSQQGITKVYKGYTVTDNQKSVTLILNTSQILADLTKHLFFIWVETKGNPTSNVPCGMDNSKTVGVTLYMGNIYNLFMNRIKEVGNTCQIPQNFIDEILKFKALSTAIDSSHYTQGIEFFNKWFKGDSNKVITNKCGCNG